MGKWAKLKPATKWGLHNRWTTSLSVDGDGEHLGGVFHAWLNQAPEPTVVLWYWCMLLFPKPHALV